MDQPELPEDAPQPHGTNGGTNTIELAELTSRVRPETDLDLASISARFASMEDLEALEENEFEQLVREQSLPLSLFIKFAQQQGIAPPSASLLFRGLHFRKDGMSLLSNASGYMLPGEMTCVLGAPGSGVANLFNVLMMRTRGGLVSGELLVNGRPPSETHARTVGYVPKDDAWHIPTLTVRESLMFVARMRCEADERQLRMRVDVILGLLGLLHVADSIVGDNQLLRGISGGERRRLSIGVELLGHSLFLMDRPTDGLDSAAAFDVCQSLRKIADAGYSVMAQLVQPSNELFALFDNVMLMSAGHVVYFGPREAALEYITGLGFVKPHYKSVPNFLEELTGDPSLFWPPAHPDEEAPAADDAESQPPSLARAYMESSHYEELGKTLWKATSHSMEEDEAEMRKRVALERSTELASTAPHLHAATAHIDHVEGEYAASVGSQIKHLSVRGVRLMLRNPKVLLVRLVQPILVGIMLGTCFLDMAETPQAGLDRMGLLFYLLAFQGFGGVPVIPVLASLRAVFSNQRLAGLYSTFSFFISLVSVNIPLAIVDVFLLVTIVYDMAGLTGGLFSENYWVMFFTLLATNLSSWTFCLLVAILSPSAETAQAIAPVLMSLFFIFSGFLAPLRSIPEAWRFMYYGGMFTHSFKALAINEAKTLVFSQAQCTAELLPPLSFIGSGLPFPETTTRVCPMRGGDDLLDQYDMNGSLDDRWFLMGMQWIFYLAFNVAVLYALTFIRIVPDDVIIPPRTRVKDEECCVGDSRAKDKNEEVYLTFRNLSYFVDIPDRVANEGKMFGRATRELQLLNEVSGLVRPGELVALMGSSGAGKTTLMDVIAGFKTEGRTTGELLFNGKPRDQYFPRIAGYVEQFDALEPNSTVFEAIKFSADLRLADRTAEQRHEAAETVLEELGLTIYRNRLIGLPGEEGGLTPAVRKKITIATELVAGGRLLFLDEPTTGLASAGAYSVMSTVQKLSEAGGRTIICTIHQPSEEIFRMFTKLLLLSKGPQGGEVVYFGQVADIEEYLASIGRGRCPPGRNLADFVVDATGGGITKKNHVKAAGDDEDEDEPEDGVVVDAREAYLASPMFRSTEEVIEQGIVPEDHSPPKFDSVYAYGYVHQFAVIVQRFFNGFWRNRAAVATRIGSSLLVAFVLGTLYFDIENDQTGAYNRVASIFVSILFSAYLALLGLPAITAVRPIFYRERAARAYAVMPYYMARVVAEAPFLLAQTLAFAVPAYWLMGYKDEAGAFFKYLAGMWFVNTTFAAFTQAIAAMSPDAEIGTGVNTVMLAYVVLFAGFVIIKSSIPAGWIWSYWVSPFRPLLLFLVSNELEDLAFDCGDSGTELALPIPIFNTTSNPNNCQFAEASFSDPNCFKFLCPIQTGEDFLARFDIDADDVWQFVAFGLGFWFLLRSLVMVSLQKINWQKR